MIAGVRALAQAPKSPPFAKGGLEGLPRRRFHAGPPPRQHARPPPAFRAAAGWRRLRVECVGVGVGRGRGRGINPPNPPFAKGGLFGACASIPPFPPPSRHSRPIPSFLPHPVIPAKAGIHTPPIATPGTTGVLGSGLRRNDGGGCAVFIWRCLAYGDSPSPNPLPLGEGFPLGGASRAAILD